MKCVLYNKKNLVQKCANLSFSLLTFLPCLSRLVLFHLLSPLHACRLREKCFSDFLLTRQQTAPWLGLPTVINGMAN